MTTGTDKPYDPDDVPVLHQDGTKTCGRPPAPWTCSRDHGHEGPCAATRNPRIPVRDPHVNCDTYTEYGERFGLYKEQQEAISKWIDQHNEEHHAKAMRQGSGGKKFRYAGAIGGAFTYEFTPTSIGMCVSVRCSCGAGVNVSDYDNW